MATATIPELIQPGVLFTPNDAPFSIASGALPNTDDALALDGTLGTWRAYQPAISGIHYPASPSDPFTVCFWLNHNQATNGTPNPNGNLSGSEWLMGVTSITLAGGAQATTGSTTDFRWGISLASTNRVTTYQRAVGASSRCMVAGRAAISNGLQLFTIRDPGGGSAPTLYQNLASASSTSSGGTTGTPAAISSPNFAIGPYSLQTGWGVVGRIIQLGKVALFSRLITDDEIADLITSMTLGPPSP